LYIDGTYVYLYGIYTNPDIYDAAEAQLYLEQLVEGKEVYCDVVAYTTQTQMATALCFVDGVFINGDMVQNSLALDVALK
jgi:endonuclease YncB( thermonuclease family)